MKKLLLVILMSFMVIGLVACSNDEVSEDIDSAANANIYGQVIYPSRNTIANTNNNFLLFTVVYLDGEKYQVTDLEGRFAFYNVSKGEHILKVDDGFFTSEEYKVEVRQDNITGVELDAVAEAIQLYTYYSDDNTIEKYLYATASYNNLDSLKVSYLNDGNYEELTPDEYDEYDVSDLFGFDKEYTIKVSLLDKYGKELKNFKKNICFHKVELYTPEIDDSNQEITFKWEEIDGVMEYEFILEEYDVFNEYWEEILETDILDSEITVKLDPEYTGNYRWHVEARKYNQAGQYFYKFISEQKIFDNISN